MASNTETVRAYYGDGVLAWNAATIERWYDEVWDPEIDWRAIEGAPDDVGVMYGRHRLRGYYDEWLELDRVAIRALVTARSRSTDLATELDFGVVYTLRGGKLVSGREYATYDEALAAARG